MNANSQMIGWRGHRVEIDGAVVPRILSIDGVEYGFGRGQVSWDEDTLTAFLHDLVHGNIDTVDGDYRFYS